MGTTPSPKCECPEHTHNCKPTRRTGADYKHAFITTMLAVASIASLAPTAQANSMHSTAMSARGTTFAPCPTSFAGIDPILLKPRRPGTNPCTHEMPNAPFGWEWRSALIDSGCTIHLLPYKAIYNAAHTTASNVRVRTANDSVEQVQFTGPATVHTYDAHQRPISLLLTKSHYCPELAPLISAHALAEAQCTVHIGERSSHARLPGGRIVRFRRDGRKDWLDILVPQNTNKSNHEIECHQHAHHASEHALSASPPTSNFRSAHTPTYHVDMFAGTASALRYHALDPQAKLLAIDHMPKPLFKSLLPPELRERIIYYRCDMAKISPSKYRRILRQCLGISPEQLTTAHASPPCRTLSIASRNKEAEPHFVENRPNSTIAKADYDMLERTLETIDQCHPAGSNTVISLENPVGRFRRLPIVKSIAARKGWRIFTADHCMLASSLDANPLFPRKPTTWLCRNSHPDLEPPECDGHSCPCRVGNTTRHRHVVCRPASASPLIEGQSVLPDNLFKARIPAGAFHLITTGTLPPPPTTNSLDRNNNPLEHANHIANQLFDNEDFVKRDKHSTDEHACPGTEIKATEEHAAPYQSKPRSSLHHTTSNSTPYTHVS